MSLATEPVLPLMTLRNKYSPLIGADGVNAVEALIVAETPAARFAIEPVPV